MSAQPKPIKKLLKLTKEAPTNIVRDPITFQIIKSDIVIKPQDKQSADRLSSDISGGAKISFKKLPLFKGNKLSNHIDTDPKKWPIIYIAKLRAC
jgi:hypothetical protein